MPKYRLSVVFLVPSKKNCLVKLHMKRAPAGGFLACVTASRFVRQQAPFLGHRRDTWQGKRLYAKRRPWLPSVTKIETEVGPYEDFVVKVRYHLQRIPLVVYVIAIIVVFAVWQRSRMKNERIRILRKKREKLSEAIERTRNEQPKGLVRA